MSGIIDLCAFASERYFNKVFGHFSRGKFAETIPLPPMPIDPKIKNMSMSLVTSIEELNTFVTSMVAAYKQNPQKPLAITREDAAVAVKRLLDISKLIVQASNANNASDMSAKVQDTAMQFNRVNNDYIKGYMTWLSPIRGQPGYDVVYTKLDALVRKIGETLSALSVSASVTALPSTP